MWFRRGKLYNFRQRDAALLRMAETRNLSDSQLAVIRDYLAEELDDMSVASVKNSRRMAFTVVLSVICNGLITIVNGTGFSLPGVIGTQVLSFYLGVVPTIVTGIAAGLLWDNKNLKSTEAMHALRMELWQFLGGSVEYDELSPEQAWQKVSISAERILQKYFSHDAISKKNDKNPPRPR